MTVYAVEFFNELTIDVVASSRKAAVDEAEDLARAGSWPSVRTVRTYLYNRYCRRYRPSRHLRPAEPEQPGLFEPKA